MIVKVGWIRDHWRMIVAFSLYRVKPIDEMRAPDGSGGSLECHALDRKAVWGLLKCVPPAKGSQFIAPHETVQGRLYIYTLSRLMHDWSSCKRPSTIKLLHASWATLALVGTATGLFDNLVWLSVPAGLALLAFVLMASERDWFHKSLAHARVRPLIQTGGNTDSPAQESDYEEFRHRSTITLLQAAAICAGRDPYNELIVFDRDVKIWLDDFTDFTMPRGDFFDFGEALSYRDISGLPERHQHTCFYGERCKGRADPQSTQGHRDP